MEPNTFMELLDTLGVSAWPDVHAKLGRDKDLARLKAYAEASAQSNACHEAWMNLDTERDDEQERPKERTQAAQEALIAYRVSERRNQAAKIALWTVLYSDQEPLEYQDDYEGEAFDQMIQDDLDGRFD